MRWPSLSWLVWAFSSSIVLHGVAYASLGFAAPRAQRASTASEASFEIVEPRELEPKVAPIPEKTADERPEPVALPARAQRANPAPNRAPNPPPTPARAQAAAALDLSGVTLTNDANSGFAMPTGNGQHFEGAIGSNRVAAESAFAPRALPALPREPELVAVSDLSSRPLAPSLADALRRNYPEAARRRALGGSASVSARLDTDGVVRQASVLVESEQGFGDACRRTLLGSRWSAPRDRNGRPVRTEIRYTCRFVVDP